jgi:hypothetical protein
MVGVVRRRYGAYGARTPLSFTPLDLPLIDRGVMVAVAHVRGGGEGGARWHSAATKARKPNTFRDTMAAVHAVKQHLRSLQLPGKVPEGAGANAAVAAAPAWEPKVALWGRSAGALSCSGSTEDRVGTGSRFSPRSAVRPACT